MPMFNNLLESKPKKQRTVGGMIFSVVMHVLMGVGAVYGTMQATEKFEKPKEEKVDFAEVKKNEPPPEAEKPPPPPDVTVAPPPPKGFQVLTAPVDIPDVIPDVDITKSVTNEDDFSGKGVAGGVAKGVVGGTGPVGDQPYFEFQVEKQAIAAPGNPTPRYPEILKSDHELFSSAIRAHLPAMRFFPAEIGGRKVKVLVQQPFEFSISG